MTDPGLREVQELDRIKGVAYPAGTRFRQLIVTGPPGSGKSTRVRQLGGWPDEGYLNLAQRRWWHAKVLTVRPREVHLGLPFRGIDHGLALFEKEWLEADPKLELQIGRIAVPSPDKRLSFADWRRRFVFEFLLPPADRVFAARRERAYRHTHPVDRDLSLAEVTDQMEIFRQVAWHFHQAKIGVVVRDDFDGPPKVFATTEPPKRPQPKRGPRDRTPLLHRWLDRLTRTKEIPTLDQLDRLQLNGSRVRIKTTLLPIELALGPQRIRIQHDRSLAGVGNGEVLLFDPEEYSERIGGFVRLVPGERVRIGKGDQEHAISLKLPDNILPRFEIAHEGDRLALTDLHSPTGAVVSALSDPEEADRIGRDRRRALEALREIYGGPLRLLPPDEALANLRRANAELEQSRFRPRDSMGRPGGVVEIPTDTTPIIIGDLHANLDNLLTLLSSGRFLECVEHGQATLLFLGDAVHPEEEEHLREMDSSLLMMDLILRLLLRFPERVIYLRGNHDSFSHEVTKEGVAQGHLWRQEHESLRGPEYRREMERFYGLLPYLAVSGDFIACHAGPPREAISREVLINIRDHPRILHQLTWNRLKSPSKPAGYTKRDVRALRSALGMSAETPLFVSHNPPRDGETAWLHLGGIENHHLVFDARHDQVAVFTRLGNQFSPQVFKVEQLLEAASRDDADGG